MIEGLITEFHTTLAMVSWQGLLLGTLAVFAGALIQGATGIGFGMIAAPVLMMIDPLFVPGTPLALSVLVSLLISVREWRSIDWPGISTALAGRVFGTVLAGATIAAIPGSVFSLVFGVMIIAAVLLSTTGWRAGLSTRSLVLAGAASGYMGTLTSIGAPPMALVYQHQAGPVIRASLAMFFSLGAAISIVALASVGSFTMKQFLISLALLPALILGFKASGWMVPKVQDRLVRRSVLALCVVMALILVWRSAAQIMRGV